MCDFVILHPRMKELEVYTSKILDADSAAGISELYRISSVFSRGINSLLTRQEI